MSSRLRRFVVLLAAAQMAFLSLGNVAMHRIVWWHECDCLEHATIESRRCNCPHDTLPSNRQDDERIRSDSTCVISQYFSRAIATPIPPAVIAVDQPSEFVPTLGRRVVDFSVAVVFWSRGPPMSR